MTELRGKKILVCTKCKTDVEPIIQAPPIPVGEVVLRYKDERMPVFCECPKCGMLYFIYELVVQKSFRMFLEDDEALSCMLYADVGSFVKVIVDGFHEEVCLDTLYSAAPTPE
jgi:hypothetical protein